MAKKKRRTPEEKEEKYEFVPPEFDEKEFLIKDLQITKISWMVTLLSIIMGIVAYFFSDITSQMAVGFLILMVSILGLKQLLSILRFDMSEVDTKGMFGNYILFALLFLGVWIICMNPPIGDNSNPVVENISIGYTGIEGYEFVTLTGNQFTITGTGTLNLNISAMVADNGQLDDVVIKWTGGGETKTYNMTLVDDKYQFLVDVTPSTSAYYFQIIATDAAGNVKDIGPQKVYYSA